MFWWFILTIKKDLVYKSRKCFAQLHTSKKLKILINNSLMFAFLDIEHMSIRDAATSSFGQEIGKLGGRSLSLPASATLFFVGSQSDAVDVNNCFLELDFGIHKIDQSSDLNSDEYWRACAVL